MITALVREKLKLDDRVAEQQAMFEDLARLYRGNGVLTEEGFASSLADTCPDRASCWGGCEDRVPRGADVGGLPGDDGSIFFPWMGADYRPGGVCVVGWNLNHGGKEWFPLTEEHVIAGWSRSELAKGRRRVGRSLFAYRSMASAAAVCGSLSGATPAVKPRPQDLAGYFDRVARVQAVKCTPLGDRSNPSAAMNDRCPPRFLLGELDILRPRALVVFGRDAREAALSVIRCRDVGDPDWLRKTRGGCGRRRSVSPWGSLDVFFLSHPSSARWPQAQEALVAELATHPFGD